ncbi:MAG: PucR family transcriptional regulator [Roseobacter sp.]
MTQVITRYFESASKTLAAKRTLQFERVPRKDLLVYTEAKGLVDALTAEHVDPETAKAYAERLKKGGAVLLVRATYRPLGAAKLARQVTAAMGPADMGGLTEEVYVKDRPAKAASILNEHPLFLSRSKDRSSAGHYMADFPIPLISRRKPADTFAFPRHARMASWPIGLLLPGTTRYGRFPFDFLIPGHKHQASKPIGLLLPGNKRFGRFPIGLLVPGQKYMAKFPIAHLVPGHKFMAKFPFGHLVPGGARMANWPFPLLINGKQGTNSLVPGHKYMAKFPFAHLVPGHKFMAKFPFAHIVPGHKFMAKFPIAHLIPGHKFMAKFPFAHIVPGHKHMAKFPFGHIVPGHKYMANFIFPHTKTTAG